VSKKEEREREEKDFYFYSVSNEENTRRIHRYSK